MNYILAHDLGTTGDKATLFDGQGQACASSFYVWLRLDQLFQGWHC